MTAQLSDPSIVNVMAPYGDSALLVSTPGFQGNSSRHFQTLADALSADSIEGIEGIVVSYDSLLIEYDPALLSCDEVRTIVHRAPCNTHVETEPHPRVHHIPAVYGGSYGPDLDSVATELDLTPAQLIDAHSQALWRVEFYGHPGGAPMLSGSPFAHPIARNPVPRQAVPQGSIAVSGAQAVIYPLPCPGGWRILARTPLRIVDLTMEQIVAYSVGDYFRFVPMSVGEASAWAEHRLGQH